MKIIKQSKKERKDIIVKANEGCDVCPCCGESKKYIEYLRQGIVNKGISKLPRNFRKYSLFKTEVADHYECKTCGAEWRSEYYDAY